MTDRTPPKTTNLASDKQRRLDQLLEENSDGAITEDQRAELEALVGEVEQVMIANAKQLAEYSESEAADAPSGAVPVTVWVKPGQIER